MGSQWDNLSDVLSNILSTQSGGLRWRWGVGVKGTWNVAGAALLRTGQRTKAFPQQHLLWRPGQLWVNSALPGGSYHPPRLGPQSWGSVTPPLWVCLCPHPCLPVLALQAGSRTPCSCCRSPKPAKSRVRCSAAHVSWGLWGLKNYNKRSTIRSDSDSRVRHLRMYKYPCFWTWWNKQKNEWQSSLMICFPVNHPGCIPSVGSGSQWLSVKWDLRNMWSLRNMWNSWAGEGIWTVDIMVASLLGSLFKM